jgi:hypothetical protein
MRSAEQNLESRAKERAEQGPSPRSSPILGDGEEGAGILRRAALNDTRTGLKVEGHASLLSRGWVLPLALRKIRGPSA